MSFFRISRKRAVPYVAPAIVAPTLAALGLSSASFTVGTTASGTITGATLASVLSISGAPTGFTINSAARTWAYDGTGSPTSGNLTLTETLAGATGNPKATTIAYTVADFITAPTLARTSTSGTNPPTFDIDTIDVNGPVAGDYAHLRWAPSTAYTTGAVHNDYHLLTSDDLLSGSISFTTFTSTNITLGAWAGSLRWERGGTPGVSGFPGTASAPDVSSAWSNDITDTVAAPPSATFVPSTTQHNKTANVTVGNFAAHDFVVGNALIFVNDLFSGRTVSSVTLTPSGGGTAINAVLDQSASTTSVGVQYIYRAPITSAGNYDIAVTISGSACPISVMTGTLTIGNPVAAALSYLNSAQQGSGSPFVANAALPCGAGSLIIAALSGDGGFTSYTNGTVVATSPDAKMRLVTSTTAGTPTVTHSGFNFGTILAATYTGT